MIIIEMGNNIHTDNAKKALSRFYSVNNMQSYPKLQLTNEPEALLLIDLSADGSLQNLSPRLLAQELKDCGLKPSVNKIYILASNIIEKKPLAAFASVLGKYLDNTVDIYIPDKFLPLTFISVPTEKQQNWKIYNIDLDYLNSNNNKHYYEFYEKDANKKLIWEGQDLLRWMGTDVNKVPPEPVYHKNDDDFNHKIYY